nr:unnamed protein product [Callosobruchus analis]
MLGKQRTENVQ